MELDDIWQAALGELEVALSKANYTTWFRGTRLVDIQPPQAVISVPSAFVKKWFEKRYDQEILKTLKKLTDGAVTHITYMIGAPLPRAHTTTPQPTTHAPSPVSQNAQASIDLTPPNTMTTLRLRPEYTFDSFIVGSNNRLAYAACQAVAQTPGKMHNPLVVYGGVGLGKTHLIHAIGNTLLAHNPKLKLLYTSCEDFANDFVQSIQSKKSESFKKKYRSIDVFLVDDIQFLSRKEGTQEEFFHTFNALHQNDRQIVMTSDRIPTAIPDLEGRLSSRFGMGMVADIQPPDLETRLAIVQEKATRAGMDIDPDVLSFIAESFMSNIRELEGALNKVIAYCQLQGEQPTLDLARAALKDQLGAGAKKGATTPDKLIDIVTRHFSITKEEIIGKQRNRRFVHPRHILMYLMRLECGMSFPQIGDALGGKDHTTIMHGSGVIEKELGRDDELREELGSIRTILYAK